MDGNNSSRGASNGMIVRPKHGAMPEPKPRGKAGRPKGSKTKRKSAFDPKTMTVPSSQNAPAAPLNIVEESCREYFPHLFKEYVKLSNHMKEILKSLDDPVKHPVPEGYCTKIMDANFAESVPPIEEAAKAGIPFDNDSYIQQFAVFMTNMFLACEIGSIGGDACRMCDVLRAAAEDVCNILSDQERIEHLLGLTIAIGRHGLGAFLDRGHPEMGKIIFDGIAKEWKKFFEPGCSSFVYNISDGIRDFAKNYCAALQLMLKNNGGTTKYNFNFIRIPRPKRKKNRDNADASSPDSNKEETGSTTKKKRKPCPVMDVIERISAVEGVAENKVYDSCPEVRAKMRAFVQTSGMNKRLLCVALGNINHNSLNRFLEATDQDQSGNCAYQRGYVFFEKLRIMDGKPKSADRVWNEQHMPSGFDITKSKGGRKPMYFYAVW